ncbi:MAG: D-alanine--D-alanine ligase family protein [Patescibacteria group bacterium]
MFNKNIGVFFGGKNPEHDISIFTGQMIIKGLKAAGFSVVPIYIDKSGIWFIGDELGDLKVFRQEAGLSKLKRLSGWNLDNEVHGKMVFYKKGVLRKRIVIDIGFPALHGQNGEDGTIQGMFEMFDTPYVGCDVYSSAISMDKVFTKLLYRANSIPTTDFLSFKKDQWNKQSEVIKKIEKDLKYPLFVKPSRLGSSIAISKVKNTRELRDGIEVAFHYDSKIIVENEVSNLKDLTCCVIGNENPDASLIQESGYDDDFVSYEDKYIEGGGTQFGKSAKKVIIPASVDKKTTVEIQEMAKQIYRLVGCSGISRVDFLYDSKTKKYFANEINTLPGILYRHLWQKSGVDFEELLKKLVGYAIDKHKEKEKYTHIFESEVLKSGKSSKLKLGF